MFGNFIACRLDGLPVRGPLAGDARRMAFEPAHKLLETASEAIFISSSSSEVKPETHGVEGAGTSGNVVSEREPEAIVQRGALVALVLGVPARSRSFRCRCDLCD